MSAKANDHEKYQRNKHNARKAYDSVLHFQKRVSLSEEEAASLNAGIQELKTALQALGETV